VRHPCTVVETLQTFCQVPPFPAESDRLHSTSTSNCPSRRPTQIQLVRRLLNVSRSILYTKYRLQSGFVDAITLPSRPRPRAWTRSSPSLPHHRMLSSLPRLFPLLRFSLSPSYRISSPMKQTTLFKHIKGVPPPPAQQASLKSMWAKRDKSDAVAAAGAVDEEKGQDEAEEDVEIREGTSDSASVCVVWLGSVSWRKGKTTSRDPFDTSKILSVISWTPFEGRTAVPAASRQRPGPQAPESADRNRKLGLISASPSVFHFALASSSSNKSPIKKSSPVKKRAASASTSGDEAKPAPPSAKKPRVAKSSVSPAKASSSTKTASSTTTDKKKPAPTSKAASQPEEDGEEEDEPVKKTAAKGKGKAKKVVPEEVKEESEEEDQIRTGRKVKEASVGEAGSAASEEEESGGSEGEEEMTDEEVEEAVTKKASSNLYVADFPISSGPIDTLAESFVFPLLHPCHPCRHPSFISSSFSYPPTPLNPSPISQRADAAAHKASLSVGSYPHWDVGTPVPYAALVACFAKIESTSKRLEILSYLTAFLVLVAERAGVPKTGEDLNDAKGKGKAKVEPGDEILKVVYLCINRVSLPLYPCCSYML
jgi:hypothetical protein